LAEQNRTLADQLKEEFRFHLQKAGKKIPKGAPPK